MRKKVVIIGSGLGGLSCGVILAKNGYDVTVLEQGNQPGGCLQCFTRRGAKFETGMHFIGSASEGQTLDRIMRYLEVKKDVTLAPLDPEGYEVVSIGGQEFRFANGREAFIKQMASYFPHQRTNLERYYDLVELLAGASSLHSLRDPNNPRMATLSLHRHTLKERKREQLTANSQLSTYQLRTIPEVIGEIITDPLLAKVLVGNLPLYAAEKDKTPFSTHAFIMDFYNQSAYRFVGGSETAAASLVRTIEKYGGRIVLNHQARKIICDETHAVAVDEFPADYVISDAHPMRTLELVDSKLIRPAFRERINAIPQTVGCFSVYLDFKKDTIPYMNSNYYGYLGDTPWGCEQYDEHSWPKGYLYMHFCQESNPKYATTGVILSYMQMSDVAQWADTMVGHRGADYEEFKIERAERLLEVAGKSFPNLRSAINHYYTSTPLTYRDYTGTEGGGMYGVAKDVRMGVACRVPHKTKIPNLFQTGQNINSHGMLGVMVGTIVTCSELLTPERIYQQISRGGD